MTNTSVSNREDSVNPEIPITAQKHEQQAYRPNPILCHFDNLYDHLSLARAMSAIIWKSEIIAEIDDDILAKFLFGLYEHLEEAFQSLNQLDHRNMSLKNT